METIGKNKDFEHAAKALHQDWTTEKVHRLIKVVDDFVASSLAKQAESAGVGVSDIVPGKMHCAKCDFSVLRTVLNVSTGNAYAGNNKTEPCPNGCGPLWPITWEQEARDGYKLCDQLFERAQVAEAALAQRAGSGIAPDGESWQHKCEETERALQYWKAKEKQPDSERDAVIAGLRAELELAENAMMAMSDSLAIMAEQEDNTAMHSTDTHGLPG